MAVDRFRVGNRCAGRAGRAMRAVKGGKPETFQRLHNAVTLSYILADAGAGSVV
jgi:hypothetical protein